MKDKKKILIGTLCTLIMIMAVGYALLSQQLSINGSASITSNWQVEITNIRELEKSTGATTNNTNYTATTASFNTSLTSPGDYALYEVTVTNKGTLDAVLSAKPTVTTGNNEAITYELEGIKKGDKILKNNGTDTFTIKVQYNPSTTTQPTTLTSNIEVTLNYEQDLGQVVVYDEYVVGDVVNFAGEKWYVIENSNYEKDYVALMKADVLNLIDYGKNYAKGVDYPGQDSTLYENVMSYYWDNNCHVSTYAGFPMYYGTTHYESDNISGCSGHSDYNNSKIKEMLENEYLPTLGIEKLKLVNGYKIRLLTINELIDNFGYTYSVNATSGARSYRFENVPEWFYSDIGYKNVNIWTMSPDSENNDNILTIGYMMDIGTYKVSEFKQVRPVINLLKSEIE